MKKNNIYRLSIVTVAVLIGAMALMGISCGVYQKSQRVITVSIQPQKYFLEKIVGDKFEVVCLLSQGSNPEAYEPSLSHLMNLEKSEAYFCIGNIGFELAIVNKARANNPDLKIFENSKGIDLLRGSHDAADGHQYGHEVDPHVWTSVPNAMIISKNMLDAVVSLDPKHESYYNANYNKLCAELAKLQADIAAELDSLGGTSFLVWHPSLSYFARDYGLNQISMEYEGKEMPASFLKREIDKARTSGAKVFFFQKEFDSRQVETVNQQIGAKLITINPMNHDWDLEMRKIADALAGK